MGVVMQECDECAKRWSWKWVAFG